MKIKKLKSHKNTEPKLTIVTFNAFLWPQGHFRRWKLNLSALEGLLKEIKTNAESRNLDFSDLSITSTRTLG